MTFNPPAKTYHFTLKLGVNGHDTAALQLNLNEVGETLTVDGAFGPKTKAGVVAYQKSDDLYADGIAGPVTQRKLAMRLYAPQQQNHRVAPGLIRGIVEHESGYFVGAVNWNVPGGVDCGWTQYRVLTENFSETSFRNAFSGTWAFDKMAGKLRVRKDRFYARLDNHKRAWELAALAHNFPTASERLSQGESMSDEPAQWVIEASGGRLQSPAEWCDFYIKLATAYCTSSSWIA